MRAQFFALLLLGSLLAGCSPEKTQEEVTSTQEPVKESVQEPALAEKPSVPTPTPQETPVVAVPEPVVAPTPIPVQTAPAAAPALPRKEPGNSAWEQRPQTQRVSAPAKPGSQQKPQEKAPTATAPVVTQKAPTLVTAPVVTAPVQEKPALDGPTSIELLVMNPGPELLTAFGHLGILFLDERGDPFEFKKGSKEGSVIEFGDYANLNGKQQTSFLLNFTVEAQARLSTLRDFYDHRRGRKVVRYAVNLTPTQVVSIWERASSKIGKTESYEFFDNNCATPVRDLILDAAGIAKKNKRFVYPSDQVRPTLAKFFGNPKKFEDATVGDLVEASLDRAINLQEEQTGYIKIVSKPSQFKLDSKYPITEEGRKRLKGILNWKYKHKSLKTFAKKVHDFTSNEIVWTKLLAIHHVAKAYDTGDKTGVLSQKRDPIYAAFTPVLVVELLRTLKNADGNALVSETAKELEDDLKLN